MYQFCPGTWFPERLSSFPGHPKVPSLWFVALRCSYNFVDGKQVLDLDDRLEFQAPSNLKASLPGAANLEAMSQHPMASSGVQWHPMALNIFK